MFALILMLRLYENVLFMFKMKLLLPILLLQPMIVYAWIKEDRCTNLHLQIENQTKTICHLIDFQVMSGFVSHDDTPLIIFPGETSSRFELSENSQHSTDFYGDAIHILMNYECGEGQMVTFISQKDKCRRSRAKVSGMVLSSYNIDASFTFSDGFMFNHTLRTDTPGTIIWTLTDKH